MLRPYQVNALEGTRDAMLDGCSAILIVCPTGGGKTVIASHLVKRGLDKGTRFLFVAHRRELIAQAFAKFARAGIPLAELGVVMAGIPDEIGGGLPPRLDLPDAELFARHGRRRPAARVQIASLDTLRTRAKPLADLVIVDEAHRSLAAGYVALRTHYPEAVFVGLTATPCRADGKPLGDQWSTMVLVSSPAELVSEGFLVAPRVWSTPHLPNLARVKVRGGDYDARELAEACAEPTLVGDVVDHWKRRGLGQRTICFAAGVEHSRKLVEQFNAEGIRAEHVDGETPTAERDAIFARLLSGETLVVSNVGVATEGWDCPPVKTLILARPTKSLSLFLQMAGRVLRPWEDAQAIILDHAGACMEHGHPLATQPWSLEGRKKQRGPKPPSVQQCRECYAISPEDALVCVGCGKEFPARLTPAERGAPKSVDGELVEVVELSDEDKLAAWGEIVRGWHAANARRKVPLKPGWVAVRFRERFKCGPPKGAKLPEWTREQRLARELADEAPVVSRDERAELLEATGRDLVEVSW